MLRVNNSLVSVIVTTYNRRELLRLTLNSILNQSYTNFEIIIVDNYSDYDFFSFIKSFEDKRIRAFQNNNNGIIAINRNLGIKQSKGEYIAFCDDDDLWSPIKLQKQIEQFNINNSFGICFTKVDYIDIYGNLLGPGKDLKWYQKKLTLSSFLISMGYITTSSIMISKSVVQDIGYFNESISLIAFEDYEYISRILTKFKMTYLNEPLVHYRKSLQNFSISNNQDWFNSNIKCITILKNELDFNRIVYLLKLFKIYLFYFFFESRFIKR